MEPLATVLFSLYENTPRHGEWVVACLEGSWPHILGERVAWVSRPVRLDRSILVIEILDPAWEPVLKSMHAEVLEKIQETTGKLVMQLHLTSTRD